jgi:hypothetical protein
LDKFLQIFDVLKMASQAILTHYILLAGSEFVKNNLTALHLQGTISAMKGGGV